MQGRTANEEAGNVKGLRMTVGVIGIVFVLAGLYGFLDPTFFGLFDLTTTHNWIHVLTGALYSYLGFAPATLNVVAWVTRVGGLVYLALGLAGFVSGTFLSPLLVLGTNENVFHLLMGAVITVVGFMIPTEPVEQQRGAAGV